MEAKTSIVLRAPGYSLEGRIHLPLSKSMSTRLLVLSFLSSGRVTYDALAVNSDVEFLHRIMQVLGQPGGGEKELNCGDGGAVMRFALAVAAITPGRWVLTGSPRLRERPLGILYEALEQLGADLRWLDRVGYLPVAVNGKTLAGGSITIDAGESSQHLSALCLIAPLLDGGLSLIPRGNPVSEPYLHMTLEMMAKAGIPFREEQDKLFIPSGIYEDTVLHTEPDWSAAAFAYLGCALSRNSQIFMPGLSLRSFQGDSSCARLFHSLGVQTIEEEGGIRIMGGGEVVTIQADLRQYPDLLPALAVGAAACRVPASFQGLSHLRIKESDRLATVVLNLGRCGYKATAGADTLFIHPGGRSHNAATISAEGDHRIAMAFAMLALTMESLEVMGYESVDKSWPGFWETLKEQGWIIQYEP